MSSDRSNADPPQRVASTMLVLKDGMVPVYPVWSILQTADRSL